MGMKTATLPTWKIKIDAAGRGTVECDGKPVKHVRGVTFRAGLGKLSTITLELVSGSVEIEAPASTESEASGNG